MLTFIVKGGGVTHFPIGASIDVNKHDYLICLYYFLPNRHSFLRSVHFEDALHIKNWSTC